MKCVLIGWVCAGALAAAGCADGVKVPTSPSGMAGATGVAATVPRTDGILAPLLSASPRSGDLRVTKECSTYTGQSGDVCTITSSNVKEIGVGSTIIYVQVAGATSLNSDVVLDTPGPGNNKAFGHCALDFATHAGLCTFSSGTGKFTHFHANANVSYLGGPDWAWNGTYSFSPQP